jgi:hypothetical protein
LVSFRQQRLNQVWTRGQIKPIRGINASSAPQAS